MVLDLIFGIGFMMPTKEVKPVEIVVEGYDGLFTESINIIACQKKCVLNYLGCGS
jgi:hypothetical protein